MRALYETLQLGISDLSRIKLPNFQRGFVWSNQKKNDFIETLHKGFPFGSFLVYPESNDPKSNLLLLDGQQRLSTIKQYQVDPLKFWKPINRNVYEKTFLKIKQRLDITNPEKAKEWNESVFDDLILDKEDLADWADEVAKDDSDIRKELRDAVKEIQRRKNEYLDLNELSILAIKFNGSKENIAEVFANLNKGGVPLSKYEIFSAAWVNEQINLLPGEASEEQGEMLEFVKDYYTKMSQDAEFELNDFSEDELTTQRSITLSELCIALGSFVQARLGPLVSSSQNSKNEIGFGLLGIATGVDNRQLSTLNDHTEEIQRDLQIILEKIDTISNSLNEIFDKLLKRISAKKGNEYANGLTTTFKTLSYFAALWKLEPNSAEYQSTLKNIPAHYVCDALSQVWSSHGDQRLTEYYPESTKRNYLQQVSEETFEDAFIRWSSDSVPNINFSKEIKALVTIHANLSYLSGTVPYGDPFELEHIIAKKIINSVDNPQDRKIFGGSLGNCMYLPKSTNGSKKEKNLHEANKAEDYETVIYESFYFSENEFEEIDEAIKNKHFDVINGKIKERENKVGADLIERLLK